MAKLWFVLRGIHRGEGIVSQADRWDEAASAEARPEEQAESFAQRGGDFQSHSECEARYGGKMGIENKQRGGNGKGDRGVFGLTAKKNTSGW